MQNRIVKRLSFFLTLLSVWTTQVAQAQKFGYYDSEYVTSKMPEYQAAKAEMSKWTERWTKEISDKYAEIEKMERDYRNEEVLLTDPMKEERKKKISDKEQEVREFNNKVFGFDGLLFQKKTELMKSVLDLMNKAIEKVCRQKQLAILFDKSSEGIVFAYTDPRHDYSDFIMEELGLSENKDKEDKTNNPKTSTKQPK